MEEERDQAAQLSETQRRVLSQFLRKPGKPYEWNDPHAPWRLKDIAVVLGISLTRVEQASVELVEKGLLVQGGSENRPHIMLPSDDESIAKARTAYTAATAVFRRSQHAPRKGEDGDHRSR